VTAARSTILEPKLCVHKHTPAPPCPCLPQVSCADINEYRAHIKAQVRAAHAAALAKTLDLGLPPYTQRLPCTRLALAWLVSVQWCGSSLHLFPWCLNLRLTYTCPALLHPRCARRWPTWSASGAAPPCSPNGWWCTSGRRAWTRRTRWGAAACRGQHWHQQLQRRHHQHQALTGLTRSATAAPALSPIF